MDLSKLPRMSETPKPPESQLEPQSPAAPNARQAEPQPPAGVGGEVWLGVAVGLIVMLMFPYFPQWVVSKFTSYKPPFLPITYAGAEVPYVQSVFFIEHLGLFLFAVGVILESILLIAWRQRLVLAAALLLMLAATALNLFHVLRMVGGGFGLPIMSALAVAFGGYAVFVLWNHLKTMRSA